MSRSNVLPLYRLPRGTERPCRVSGRHRCGPNSVVVSYRLEGDSRPYSTIYRGRAVNEAPAVGTRGTLALTEDGYHFTPTPAPAGQGGGSDA